MSRILDPGTYKAKIADYGMSKTQSGKPQAFIVFDVNGTNISWFGLLDPKSSDGVKKAPLEISVKTLLDCGFSGDTIEVMAAGKSSNCLEIGKEMDLVIEDDLYNGEVKSRIKWVNVPGFIPGGARMTYEDASASVQSGALRAELMRQRKQLAGGGTPVPKSPL